MPAVPMHAVEAGEEEVQALTWVARSGRFSQGAEVEALEEEFAAYVGTSAPHSGQPSYEGVRPSPD